MFAFIGKLTVFSLLFSCCAPAFAIDLDRGFSGPSSSESEFFSINKDKRMTIQVNFVSGVQKPGIHHLPDNLHLLEAISLAGGIQSEFDPGKVFIKRKKKDQYETIRYDLNDILTKKDEQYPELKNNDTIMIGTKSHTTEGVVMGLSIVGSIVAILSGYLIIAKKR